jgi:hypothetical protein
MLSGPRLRQIQRMFLTRVAAAVVLLFAIAADIAADTRCHPLPRAQVGAGLSATPAPTDQDPCGAKCVPDCFCCSTLSVTAVGLPLESAALAGRVASARERDCPPGVHPALYHPPIVLS